MNIIKFDTHSTAVVSTGKVKCFLNHELIKKMYITIMVDSNNKNVVDTGVYVDILG